MKRIKRIKPKVFKLFGLRFEMWNVVDGYRLSVDIKTTRYIFKPFWYCTKCNTIDLID